MPTLCLVSFAGLSGLNSPEENALGQQHSALGQPVTKDQLPRRKLWTPESVYSSASNPQILPGTWTPET